MLPLFFYQQQKINNGELVFTLLDVGQGLAAVVETQNHALVFDTGPKFSQDFNTGSAVVLPFLRQQQRQQLDMLLVSHGDNDHIGGTEGLLAGIKVQQILSSAPRLLKTGRAAACVEGTRWTWDGVEFEILHPSGQQAETRENNQSCVLLVRGPHGSVLLPGDIEKEAESRLVAAYGARLKADILVAPHHGSKTSSTAEFIQAVQPDYVLYPVGYRNRYRFPYQAVMRRYQQAGARGLQSSGAGAIQFFMGEDRPEPLPWQARQAQQRYWHHRVTE